MTQVRRRRARPMIRVRLHAFKTMTAHAPCGGCGAGKAAETLEKRKNLMHYVGLWASSQPQCPSLADAWNRRKSMAAAMAA
jgi:hypothetical protein